MKNTDIIVLQNLCKTINERNIIKNVNLKIESKKFVAIMGPSGSGKTTLLNMISGLITPTVGEIKIFETEVQKLAEPKLTKFRRKNMSYIFQEYNLVPYLNVWDNIVLIEKLLKHKIDKQKIYDIIKQVGLEGFEKSEIKNLSGGQKQRVAIARSLVGDCKIIFGDEPTGALDLKTRNEIISLLKNSCEVFAKTLMLVTHDPFVASHADEVIFLVDGEIKKILNKPKLENILIELVEVERNV